MELVAFLLLGIVSLIIVYEDFKGRTVHLFALAGFLGVGVFFHFWVKTISWLDLGLNQAFLILLFAFSFCISKFYFGKSLFKMIGLGDLIYLVIVTLFFDFPTFVIWFNLALVGSLIFHLIVARVLLRSRNSKQLIPLAGYSAIIFTLAILYETYVGSAASFIYQP